MTYARITGTGSGLPEKVLTNNDLEKIVETTDQWIMERSGIKKRHILTEGQTAIDIAEIAANNALEAAGVPKNEIDLIVVATFSSGYYFPSAACMLQQRLGIKDCPAFDVSAACSGFIYGLNIANQYIKSGTAKNILLVATEALSQVTDWTDRSTCVLFGDGAGAVVLSADSVPGIRSAHIHADGNYNELLYAKNHMYGSEDHFTKMRGNELFKLAVNKLSGIVKETLAHNNIDNSEIDWLVPHQANLRIIQAAAKKINLPMERVIVTIAEHGNTSAAAVPLALDVGVRDGRIKRGDTMLMEVFGGGLTWGSALVDY
ncbi:MAG: ketoacyl-ACP synthase III [Gammaproteobacteria bacterium]|nr:ketoacyl-ACP synthase III [Gammaproteobacteria bacterium]